MVASDHGSNSTCEPQLEADAEGLCQMRSSRECERTGEPASTGNNDKVHPMHPVPTDTPPSDLAASAPPIVTPIQVLDGVGMDCGSTVPTMVRSHESSTTVKNSSAAHSSFSPP